MTEQVARTEEMDQMVIRAVEKQCMIAISGYLDQLATAMEANNLPHVTLEDVKAMKEQVDARTEAEYGDI